MFDNIKRLTKEEKDSLTAIKPLADSKDIEPLLESIGDSNFVLLGEATHGTHEYYTWRAEISKRLIKEKGFQFIAVEGDWPDCYQINRWVKGMMEPDRKIEEVLKEFKRWPTWMWSNWEVAAFAQWLRQYNSRMQPGEMVGFYGLDVYSLWESMESIVRYLEKEDPQTAMLAKQTAECFEPYKKNDSYATAYRNLSQRCRKEVVDLLTEVRQRVNLYEKEPEAGLNAELNTLVLKNVEKYYEAMAQFDQSSWNVRDSHMVETLNRLRKYHGGDSKVIVWEHNTHIGDARATDMALHGMHNVGQLVRQQHKAEGVVLVGFGSYQGSVLAGEFWGAEMEKMELPQAIEGSLEHFLHQLGAQNKLLLFEDHSALSKTFKKRFGHRAVGVVYDPHRERGNYVPSKLSDRYDAFIYLDRTEALHPIKQNADTNKTPETFPFGI